MSSIARAFTLRRKRTDSAVGSPPGLPPSGSPRHGKKSVDVRDISGPLQLLSTTNMLTYNAPDIAEIQAQRKASCSVSSGSSSRRSMEDSDVSSTSSRSRDTHLTDASSVGSISPVSSPTSDKKVNYFEATPANKGSSTLRRSISTFEIRRNTLAEEHANDPPRSESPAIPQRHPSHSKRSHVELARKRSIKSISRANSVSSSTTNSREFHCSRVDFFNSKSVDSASSTPCVTPHPFGKELEQLEEVAEEFTGAINDVEKANDLQVMRERGLMRFCAAEYISEIENPFGNPSNLLSMPQWI